MHEGLTQIFSVGKPVTSLFSVDRGLLANPIIGTNKIFEILFTDFMKHVGFGTVRCVVIGSPGSLKDDFLQYLSSEAQKLKIISIIHRQPQITNRFGKHEFGEQQQSVSSFSMTSV